MFSNCPGGRTIPPPLSESAPAAFRADRDHQVAAALFYAADFGSARAAFRRIASDAGSPWRAIAPYLAARALVRQGTVSDDRASLEEAARELKQLQGDATTAAYHPAVERLLEFVRLRTEPEQRLRELGAELSRGASGEATTKRLDDYAVLLDHQTVVGSSEWWQPDWTIPPEAIGAVRDADDRTDWILTIQGAGPRTHALDRWRKTSSPAWLVAALAAAKPGDADAAALVEAAGRVGETSPAFPSATCYAVQLMLGAGEANRARARIDEILPRAPGRPESARGARSLRPRHPVRPRRRRHDDVVEDGLHAAAPEVPEERVDEEDAVPLLTRGKAKASPEEPQCQRDTGISHQPWSVRRSRPHVARRESHARLAIESPFHDWRPR